MNGYNIPSDRNTRIKQLAFYIKITVCILAGLFVILAVSLFIDLLGSKIEYTLQAGDPLPSSDAMSEKKGTEYDLGDYDESSFSAVGQYVIHIKDGMRRIKVELKVIDTKAPRADVLALKVNIDGPFPEAIDFFDNIEDASAYTAAFKNSITPEGEGEYEVLLELADVHGNRNKCKTTMTVIKDTEAPVFSGPKVISGYLGEAIAYTKDIKAVDNCFGEVSLTVDTSAVNPDKEGSYKVIYKATDKAGNSSTYEVTLKINAERVTREVLMQEIGKLAASQGITKAMTKEEQCKRIYAYVNSPKLSPSNANVRFTNESNTDRSDWMLEAYLTMKRGSGDCYSYFALSKAFFEYFGIENRDIERSKGVTTLSGTHFWSMVNIGSGWYYYDATRLAVPHNTGSGCLFTEAQLIDYNTNVKKGFLTYDHAGYPTASTQTINTSYTW